MSVIPRIARLDPPAGGSSRDLEKIQVVQLALVLGVVVGSDSDPKGAVVHGPAQESALDQRRDILGLQRGEAVTTEDRQATGPALPNLNRPRSRRLIHPRQQRVGCVPAVGRVRLRSTGGRTRCYGERRVRVEFGANGALEERDFPLEGLTDNAAFLDVLREPSLQTVHTQETSLENIFIRVTGRELA